MNELKGDLIVKTFRAKALAWGLWVYACLAPALAFAQSAQSLGQLAQNQWMNEFKGLAVGLEYLAYLGGAALVAWGIYKMIQAQQSHEPASAFMKFILAGMLLLSFGLLAQVVTSSFFGQSSVGIGTIGIPN